MVPIIFCFALVFGIIRNAHMVISQHNDILQNVLIFMNFSSGPVEENNTRRNCINSKKCLHSVPFEFPMVAESQAT